MVKSVIHLLIKSQLTITFNSQWLWCQWVDAVSPARMPVRRPSSNGLTASPKYETSQAEEIPPPSSKLRFSHCPRSNEKSCLHRRSFHYLSPQTMLSQWRQTSHYPGTNWGLFGSNQYTNKLTVVCNNLDTLWMAGGTQHFRFQREDDESDGQQDRGSQHQGREGSFCFFSSQWRADPRRSICVLLQLDC